LKIRDISTALLNGKEFREYSNCGYRYLRVSDLDKFDISNKNPRYIELSNFPESIRLSKNDILISRSGSLGLVSVVTDEILDSILSSHIFKLSLDTKIVIPEYIECYLRSALGQFQFFQKNNGGIIPELNQPALKDISVIVPPIAIQTEIVTHIAQILAQAKLLQAEAAQLLATTIADIEHMILGESA
jgi:restriction endonuclease S subunit